MVIICSLQSLPFSDFLVLLIYWLPIVNVRQCFTKYIYGTRQFRLEYRLSQPIATLTATTSWHHQIQCIIIHNDNSYEIRHTFILNTLHYTLYSIQSVVSRPLVHTAVRYSQYHVKYIIYFLSFTRVRPLRYSFVFFLTETLKFHPLNNSIAHQKYSTNVFYVQRNLYRSYYDDVRFCVQATTFWLFPRCTIIELEGTTLHYKVQTLMI